MDNSIMMMWPVLKYFQITLNYLWFVWSNSDFLILHHDSKRKRWDVMESWRSESRALFTSLSIDDTVWQNYPIRMLTRKWGDGAKPEQNWRVSAAAGHYDQSPLTQWTELKLPMQKKSASYHSGKNQPWCVQVHQDPRRESTTVINTSKHSIFLTCALK